MKVNKKIQGTFALLTAVLIALLVIGCPDPGDNDPVERTITVAAQANRNGSVVPSKTRAFAGEEITLTATPNSGYRLTTNSLRWSSGGSSNIINPANPRFTMPDGNVTITATWVSEAADYTFTIKSSTTGITASPMGGNGGEAITVTVTPPRPELTLIEDSLTMNGEPIYGTSFIMPYENVVLNGLFEYKNWRNDVDTPTLFGPRQFVSLEDVDDAPIIAFIGGMTNGQKGGQMVQATRDHVGTGSGTLGGDSLGSILSGGGSSPGGTTSAWVNMVNTYQSNVDDSTQKIPLLYGIDAVHGHNTLPSATVFPHNIGFGAYAVGDIKGAMEDIYESGRITALEMLWTGCNWTFAPCVTPSVDVRWGRTYESFGEDIELSSALTVSIVRGFQDHGVAATLKHFYGENHTDRGQNANNAEMTYEELAPHLEPFRTGVQIGGAYTMMPTMGSINLGGGMTGLHGHSYLMNTLTKTTGPNEHGMGENFGFKGFIITDYERGGDAGSVTAGIDMAMRNSNATGVRSTFAGGGVSDARRNDAVLRILRVKTAMGLMEVQGGTLVPVPQRYTAGTLPDADHRAIAREMTAKTITLLKNDNDAIAKLAAAQNILLLGQAGANIGLQCGGWTVSWQGGTGVSTTGVNILEGFQEKGKNVTHTNNSGGNATNEISGNYDAIVAVLGETPHSENDGDRPGGNIILRTGSGDNAGGNFNDVGMLRAAYNYKLDNPDVPLIVIMMSARPMLIADPVYTGGNNQGHPLYGEPHYEQWDAFIAAWLPGNMGGGAIADVIFDADKDFVAKTPLVWRTDYRRTGSGAAGWRTPYPEDSVIYPYGWGLKK